MTGYLVCSLLLCVISEFTAASQTCPVEQNPRTTVALVNTNTTFTCFDNDTGSFPVRLEVDKKVLSSVNESERQRYQMMGITWETIEDSGNKKIGFTITINATLENNGRQIVCYFDPCISSKAELIVVDAPPNPPLAPVVTPQNYTSLLITWHPPWDHPVNMYTIYVRIDDTNEIINFTTTELSYSLTQDLYNFTTCDALYISIEASTDVGMSGQSSESLYGFIKGVQEINVSNISSSYSFIENDKLSIEILNPPKVCTYETLSYHFSVINNRNNTTINITSQQPNVTVDFNFTMMPGDTLTVLLTMSDESNTRTIMFLLAGNIDVAISASTTSYDILPQSTVTVSSYYTSEMSSSPSPSNKEENQLLMMVIIGSSVFGVLLLLLVLITSLIVIVALFMYKRSKRIVYW